MSCIALYFKREGGREGERETILIFCYNFFVTTHRGGSDSSLTDRSNTNLVQNTVQLLVLNIDSFITMAGGIKSLVTESCGVAQSRRRRGAHDVS